MLRNARKIGISNSKINNDFPPRKVIVSMKSIISTNTQAMNGINGMPQIIAWRFKPLNVGYSTSISSVSFMPSSY